MIPKLAQIELVPGKMLILPYKKDNVNVQAGMVVPREEQDNSMGIITRSTPLFEAMPDEYDPGNGQLGKATPRRTPFVGNVVIYSRVASQAIALEDDNGNIDNYRIIGEDDIVGYVDAD